MHFFRSSIFFSGLTEVAFFDIGRTATSEALDVYFVSMAVSLVAGACGWAALLYSKPVPCRARNH